MLFFYLSFLKISQQTDLQHHLEIFFYPRLITRQATQVQIIKQTKNYYKKTVSANDYLLKRFLYDAGINLFILTKRGCSISSIYGIHTGPKRPIVLQSEEVGYILPFCRNGLNEPGFNLSGIGSHGYIRNSGIFCFA